MTQMTSVFHGVEIPEALLAGEMQNHRAASLSEARAQAGRALAIRARLLARARDLGLHPEPERNEDGQEETAEEALIRAVLSVEIEVSPPSKEKIREVYDRHPDSFKSPPLVEASHILVALPRGADADVSDARARADDFIAQIQAEPGRFTQLATEHSACPSAGEGGWLGQLRPGDVLPEIWDALADLEVGAICAVPIRSEHGWHVLRLDRAAAGQRLPFAHVMPHIAMELEARSWTQAAAHYVENLISQSLTLPHLKLDSAGRLDQGPDGMSRADNILGFALADIRQAFAALPPNSRLVVEEAAARSGEAAEDELAAAIGKFLSSASDEAWTQLISRLRDSDAPLADCLSLIVERELSGSRPAHTLIRMRNAAGTKS